MKGTLETLTKLPRSTRDPWDCGRDSLNLLLSPRRFLVRLCQMLDVRERYPCKNASLSSIVKSTVGVNFIAVPCTCTILKLSSFSGIMSLTQESRSAHFCKCLFPQGNSVAELSWSAFFRSSQPHSFSRTPNSELFDVNYLWILFWYETIDGP